MTWRELRTKLDQMNQRELERDVLIHTEDTGIFFQNNKFISPELNTLKYENGMDGAYLIADY
jgi:hypothetical protein